MADPSTNTEMVRVPILGENGRISDDYIPESIPQAVTAVEHAAESAASSANAALQKAAAAEKSASAASSSAEQAKSYANNANTYMTTAESHAGSAATDAAAASKSASAAAASAEQAAQSASSLGTAVTDAQSAATAAKESAAQAATSESGATSAATAAESSASAAKASETAAGSSAEHAATSAAQASSSAEAAAGSAQTATEKADSVLDHYIESAQATTLEAGSQATASVADNVLTIGVPQGVKGDTGLGIPEGGSAGQVVKKTADGAEWAYDTGAVYNSEEGLQEMSEDGTNDPIYNFGITQGGMTASMSVMGNSPEVATSYTSGSTNYKNAIGADADGPYVDLNLSGKSGGVTKYRYIDDPSQLATVDGIPTAKAISGVISDNVLSGTKTGVVVTADDAYATKPRRLTVYGATRQNLWSNPSGTSNGVTVTSNADGSMTISGTSTDNFYIYSTVYSLKPGSTYTLSIDSTATANISIQPYDSGGYYISDIANIGDNGVSKNTGVFPQNAAYARLMIQGVAGTSLSGTYRVMLNEGSTAEPWCPPGLNSVDKLRVVTAGKNAVRIGKSEIYFSGLKCVSNGDNTLTFSGNNTESSSAWSTLALINVPFEGTYSFKLFGSSDDYNIVVLNYSYQVVITASNLRNGYNYEIKSTYEPLRLAISIPTVLGVVDNVTVGLSISFGNEIPSSFESFVVTTINLKDNTLCSLPDGTRDELTIDATGAVTLTKRTEQRTIDAEHPISVDIFTPASGTNLPYVVVSNMFTPFDSIGSGISKTIFSTSWPYTENVKSRGVYRTWNATIFVDERFTDKETAKSIINEAGGTFVAHVPLSTEPQTSVTLPTLPSPNITVYHDSDVPSDITVEYERDVTIAFEQLEAKISELTVNQAIS